MRSKIKASRTTQASCASKWFTLPAELWDIVLQHLDLDSIKTLRLVSKAVALTCLTPHFLSRFKRDYTTDLSLEGLQFLEHLASNPPIAARVNSLTILCVLHIMPTSTNGKERNRLLCGLSCMQTPLRKGRTNFEQDDITEEFAVTSLTSTFKNFGRLQKIKLGGHLAHRNGAIESLDNAGWQAVRYEALRTYRRTVSAIFRSALELDTLVVYRETSCCFVTLHDLKVHTGEMIKKHGAAACRRVSIKSLALSVSATVRTNDSCWCWEPRRVRNTHAPAGFLDRSFDGVANFLSLMKNVRDLDLHLYPIRGQMADRTDSNMFVYDKVFSAITDRRAMLPQLEKCSIQGIYTKEDAMLKFLATHSRINHLKLARVTLTSSNSWARIFQFLSRRIGDDRPRQMPSLKRVDLSYLWNWRFVLVNLTYTWEKLDKYSNSSLAHENRFHLAPQDLLVVHTRHFNDQDLDRGLKFHAGPLQVKFGIQTLQSEINEWRSVEFV